MQKINPMKTIYAYAGNHRYLILLGRILAVISAWIAMIPFYDLWKIIKIAIDGEDLSVIKALGLQAVGWTILAMFFYLCALMCTHISAFRVQANMRSNLMRKILTLPLGVFDKEGTGKIRRIVDESTAATETFIAHNIPDKAAAIATPIGLIVLLAVFDWRLGLICIIPLIFAFICMMSVMGKGMQEDMAQYQNALETMSTEAVEYVRGIPVVKTFGQSVHSFRRFKKSIEDYSEWSIGYTQNMRKPMTGYMVCINSIFDHVKFSYSDNTDVLKDVSFIAKQGEVTALIGPSGGGKTTVSRLAARFWDITGGKITIGGMNVSETDPEQLLSMFSIVFQDVTLFNNTVMENIRIGKKGATDEEVMQAAKLACCDDFIKRLPDGYNTQIGENGCNLSGGERQRLSIARAFLKDAPIILLDEATASLDAENETQIQTALSQLMKNKTVLMIAHRMRTISDADNIVVLKDGIVAEQGSPDELIRQNGIYRNMLDKQQKSAEWKMK